MSTELDARGPLAMTRFHGGRERGACVQLTRRELFPWNSEGRWTSVRVEDIPALIADLQAVVDGTIGEEP